MERNKSLWIVDAALFFSFLAVLGTGLVLEYVLPAKKGLTLFNFTRHDIGELHFILSLILIGIVLLHLILHLKWVFTMYQKQASGLKVVMLSVLFLLLITIITPFFLPVKEGAEEGRGRADHMSRQGQSFGGRN